MSPSELSALETNLSDGGRKLVKITYDQMLHFAGNILEVKNMEGDRIVVMSDTAYSCLTDDQIALISDGARIVPVHIPDIEKVGGGSARCMMAEVIPV